MDDDVPATLGRWFNNKKLVSGEGNYTVALTEPYLRTRKIIQREQAQA